VPFAVRQITSDGKADHRVLFGNHR
jgi:hypothetical protein